MLEIHDFWVRLFPMFQNYEFIYVFLDIETILVLISIFFELPSLILLSRKDRLWRI